jgi:hypothetical protein
LKAHLLFPDHDFDFRWAVKAGAAREAADAKRPLRSKDFVWEAPFPWQWQDLTHDLALETVLRAMAQDDPLVYEVCRNVLLAAVEGDAPVIRHRQPILEDALAHPQIVRELYGIATEAHERQKKHFLGSLARYPDSVLRESVHLMQSLLELLRKLHQIALGQEWKSKGWADLFQMLRANLDDEYLESVEHHLKQLRIQNDTLIISQQVGLGGKGAKTVLHESPFHGPTWWARITSAFMPHPKSYSFSIHPRDDAGIQALSDLRNRGVSLVATALGESAEHVRSFFQMLRAELAFYVGCINLHETLRTRGVATTIPRLSDEEEFSFEELTDCSLGLTVDRVVGNDLRADGKRLIVVTGANTGGKSTFLRSLGLAQLMMQAGMFVSAAEFTGHACHGVFTHYKREEDSSMESGKLDEELRRMSGIVDHLRPGSLLLLNESFSSTNEREGSEIGRQIIEAALARGVSVACVTHQYELANRLAHLPDSVSLRAERERTFKLTPAMPLPTSHGEDIYRRIFVDEEYDEHKNECRA